jgi:hypothetical protein
MITSRPVDEGRDIGRDPDHPWTWKSALAALFCGVFVTLQVAVPLVKLASPRPARFGWHMWSARWRPATFVVVMRDGTKRPADLARHVGRGRGEMELAAALPPHLCRVVPEAAAVEVRSSGLEAPRVHACR